VAGTGRPKAELTLTEAERLELMRAVRAATISQAYSLRCRIVLASGTSQLTAADSPVVACRYRAARAGTRGRGLSRSTFDV
jgi:hypothetical protein